MRGQIHSREINSSVGRLSEYSIALLMQEGADPSLLATLVAAADGPVMTRAVLTDIQFVHAELLDASSITGIIDYTMDSIRADNRRGSV